jgi:hypothetical protein
MTGRQVLAHGHWPSAQEQVDLDQVDGLVDQGVTGRNS